MELCYCYLPQVLKIFFKQEEKYFRPLTLAQTLTLFRFIHHQTHRIQCLGSHPSCCKPHPLNLKAAT